MRERLTLHFLNGNYFVDSRVRNETEFLANEMRVVVFCLSDKSTSEISPVHSSIRVKRFIKSNWFFGIFLIWPKMLLSALKLKPDVVHAHDIQALPFCYVVSAITSAKLIYDSHELWSESHHKPRSKLVLIVAEIIERALARRADAIITVSERIAIFLSGYFRNGAAYCIRNVPTYLGANGGREYSRRNLRFELGLKEDDCLGIYQGLIKEERGVFIILDALKFLEASGAKLSFLFIGGGPDFAHLEKSAESFTGNVKVFVRPAVPQDVLGCFTRAADFGVHAIKNTCLNHEYCLPNKLFEYLQCGLPVVVSDLKEMSSLVREHSLGLTFVDGDPRALAECFERILEKNVLAEFKTSVGYASGIFDPDTEYKKLEQVYRKLLC